MNQLTVRQRQTIYAVVAAVLLAPILYLGTPNRLQAAAGGAAKMTPGGRLAQLRTKYELGEASLGDVDPTSATMNLVLLGLRGVAASLLWQQADHEKSTKNFNQMEQTIESIILLQPHFRGVWEYQSWNLAFNVSAECDAVEDRFFWVKRGAKFLIRGTRRNERVAELPFETGRFFGQKLGRADEKGSFRKFFVKDPDEERWHGGPDEDVNPDGKDNYLVARDWYFKANDVVSLPGVTQHKMDLSLFLAYPYRSLMDYGNALETEGVQVAEGAQDDASRQQARQQWGANVQKTWEEAYQEWTTDYGLREIETAANMGGVIVLDSQYNDTILKQIADREGMPFPQKVQWQDQYRKMTNYPSWKQRCDVSQRPETIQARYDLAEGKRLFNQAEDVAALKHLEDGMTAMEKVIAQYELADGSNSLLIDDQDLVEDCLKSIIIWRRLKEQLGQPIPDEFPLRKIWDKEDYQDLKNELNQRFISIYG